MSYKNLEIWQLARELSIDIHRMSLLERLDHLGRKLNRFIESVERKHNT